MKLISLLLSAQDTIPKGPCEWNAKNWIGLFVQIIVFLLVIFGIYKFAASKNVLKDKP